MSLALFFFFFSFVSPNKIESHIRYDKKTLFDKTLFDRHDIKSLGNLQDEDFDGIDESMQRIHTIVDEEIKSDIPSDRVVISG